MIPLVWYCNCCDLLYIFDGIKAYRFHDELGELILMYEKNSFKAHKLYLIGEL